VPFATLIVLKNNKKKAPLMFPRTLTALFSCEKIFIETSLLIRGSSHHNEDRERGDMSL